MELTIGSSAYTFLLLSGSVYNTAHKALEVHLKNNQIEKHVLDRCLLSGLQLIERKDRKLSQVAPALRLLLKFGAQLKVDTLLDHETTPYHLICKYSGDHHELLDSMLLSSGRGLIGAEDSQGFTALFYAVKNVNINCVRSLIFNGAGLHVPNTCCLFIEVIDLLSLCSEVPRRIITDIFDLLCNRLFATEMILVSRCSRGMLKLGNHYENKNDIKSDVKDLMKKWSVQHVHENNVIPLKMQCRRMIWNHLCPQADKKIKKLPLPPGVITYLRIPELDDILDACRKSTQNQ